MSLLHQETPNQIDDAARGEEFTRGTSRVVLSAVIATVVVSIAIAIYVITGEKPPAAVGSVVDVWAHPMHTVTPAFDATGASISQTSFDQMLIFTHVKLHNQGKEPLFVYEILTNITMPDGTINTSSATTATQYERVFQAYTDLAQWHAKPIDNALTINPGETAEGTFVTSFRMAKEQWQQRKGLDFTVGFRYQPSLHLKPESPVIDR